MLDEVFRGQTKDAGNRRKVASVGFVEVTGEDRVRIERGRV